MQRKKMPLKLAAPNGLEGQALIANKQDGLRCDNVYPELKIVSGKEFVDKFGSTRRGWDKAIYSNNTLVNMVGKDYSILSNENFFGEIGKQLNEKDINVLKRSINRDDRAFAVDYILNDDRYAVIVKSGNDKIDKIRPMLSFTTSYDGSTKTQGHFGMYREVCQNGMHVATSQIGFSLKRRGDLEYIVISEVEKLIQKFMDNEFFEIKKKFDVLAETPILDLSKYVKMVCNETNIFQFEKSKENESPSKKAEAVIALIKHEAKLLNTESNLFLGYNAFNNVLHNKMKKTFNSQYDWDAKLFNHHMELATS